MKLASDVTITKNLFQVGFNFVIVLAFTVNNNEEALVGRSNIQSLPKGMEVLEDGVALVALWRKISGDLMHLPNNKAVVDWLTFATSGSESRRWASPRTS